MNQKRETHKKIPTNNESFDANSSFEPHFCCNNSALFFRISKIRMTLHTPMCSTTIPFYSPIPVLDSSGISKKGCLQCSHFSDFDESPVLVPADFENCALEHHLNFLVKSMSLSLGRIFPVAQRSTKLPPWTQEKSACFSFCLWLWSRLFLSCGDSIAMLGLFFLLDSTFS